MKISVNLKKVRILCVDFTYETCLLFDLLAKILPLALFLLERLAFPEQT